MITWNSYDFFYEPHKKQISHEIYTNLWNLVNMKPSKFVMCVNHWWATTDYIV
jgi:hypothetical protein